MKLVKAKVPAIKPAETIADDKIVQELENLEAKLYARIEEMGDNGEELKNLRMSLRARAERYAKEPTANLIELIKNDATRIAEIESKTGQGYAEARRLYDGIRALLEPGSNGHAKAAKPPKAQTIAMKDLCTLHGGKPAKAEKKKPAAAKTPTPKVTVHGAKKPAQTWGKWKARLKAMTDGKVDVDADDPDSPTVTQYKVRWQNGDTPAQVKKDWQTGNMLTPEKPAGPPTSKTAGNDPDLVPLDKAIAAGKAKKAKKPSLKKAAAKALPVLDVKPPQKVTPSGSVMAGTYTAGLLGLDADSLEDSARLVDKLRDGRIGHPLHPYNGSVAYAVVKTHETDAEVRYHLHPLVIAAKFKGALRETFEDLEHLLGWEVRGPGGMDYVCANDTDRIIATVAKELAHA